ncbi:MAG: valine--tRNA ligase [Verrucomicrobiota bacterium]
MEKIYNPSKIEKKWLERWLDNDTFHSTPNEEGDSYCIVIPPPNVTGVLHMGHALNNTIQDVLARWRRMQGRNVVWLPGTDHAGIATQNVVERALKAEGKSREDLGREAFVERVWKWREKYGNTIISQLKRLGASCDWQRERFTMDDGLSKAVARVFVELYEKKLVYRANYIINWCPRCMTALADEESEHADVEGKLWHIRYPLGKQDSGEYIVVATTRPETMLGDTAVAVNPLDKRHEKLEDKKVILPILDRELEVIKDDFVDPEFGTGIVKVTPAHDPNDFEMGLRHDLPQINIMDENGVMNENAGPYHGLDRFECRQRLVSDLEEMGLIVKVESHAHSVGHCYRCNTVVEPRLSRQWFVSMKPLAQPAIEAVNDGRVKFVPERWTKVYLDWMENIRDWCISRQIWWGHRIPVFYCRPCGHEWASVEEPRECPECGASDIRQDEDVLDTWFSSWLWPFSAFGWPEKTEDLAFYYPTNDLVTASEIIFFWVARMVMAGMEFMGEIPFDTVYIHGTVRDDEGVKMSKSLGNALDPVEMIDKFSADALRFSLMMLTATGQDVYISDEKFEIGRNFGTKIWNAARFLQMQAESLSKENAGVDACAGRVALEDFNPDDFTADDMYIIAGFNRAVRECSQNLESYRFNDAAKVLYEYIWHHFCDWYVEHSKSVLYGADNESKKHTIKVMSYVLDRILRLLHPMMPFLTEELGHVMGYCSEADFVSHDTWPRHLNAEELSARGIDPELVEYVENKRDLVRVARTLRSDYGVLPVTEVEFKIKPHNEDEEGLINSDIDSLQTLLRANAIKVDRNLAPEKPMPSGVSALGTVYMPLEGVVDVESEIERQNKELTKIEKDLQRVENKLANRNFVTKAPEHVVNRQREMKQEMQGRAGKLKKLIETLKSV